MTLRQCKAVHTIFVGMLAMWSLMLGAFPVASSAQPAEGAKYGSPDEVVIDLSDPTRWHGTFLAYENHVESAAIQKLDQGLRFLVVPYLGKASHVWLSEPLVYPVHFQEQYPFLVVRYRASHFETRSKLSVLGLRQEDEDSDRIRFEPLKVHRLVADGQPQEFRIDLRKVTTGGTRSGMTYQIGVAVRGDGQEVVSLDLLDLRYEKDPGARPSADTPTLVDQPVKVRVVDEQRQPVAGAQVSLRSLRLDRQLAVVTNVQGEASLTPWISPRGSYAIQVTASGMTTTIQNGVKPGDEVVVRLEKAHDIQGVVRTAQGQPVKGAVVIFGGPGVELPQGQWQLRPGAVLTDDQGRWKQTGFATSRSTVVIAAWHPDATEPYESSMALGEHVTHYRLGSGPVEITLPYSWSITGQVTDDQGQPLAGVKVYRDNQFSVSDRKLPVLTDVNGQYAVRSFKPTDREVTLTFIKESKAPAQITLKHEGVPENATRDVRMTGGKAFYFLVVDQNDKPVRRVQIQSGAWNDFHGEMLSANTDAQGKLSWVSGPDQMMSFSVIHQGRYVAHVKAQPGEVTRISLRGPTVHTGTVTDAKSRQFISAFEVAIAYELNEFNRQPDRPPYGQWQRPLSVVDPKGYFKYSVPPWESTYYLRIVAEGYAPFVSPPIAADAPPQTFQVQLTPVPILAGRVLLPDGTPAVRARVYVVNRGQWLLFTSSDTFGTSELRETALYTDAQGRFKLPAEFDRKNIAAIVIVHDQGSLEIRGKDIDAMDALTIEPWATLSGQAMRSGKPHAHATIVARPLYYPQDKGKTPLTSFNERDVRWEFKVQADDQGRFTLRMPAAGYEVGKQIEYAHRAWRPSQTHHLLLKAGEERKDFKIGGEGRSFRLKLKWKDQPPEWKMGYASITPLRRQVSDQPHYKMIDELAGLDIAHHHHHHDLEVTVGFDNLVEGHDITPGKYQLRVQLWSERFTDSAKVVAVVDTIIDLPDWDKATQPTVVDLGELMVRPASAVIAPHELENAPTKRNPPLAPPR